MIEPVKPNTISLTNVISQSDINICEAQKFRQMVEIKKLKRESCCYKYCCTYDETVSWDYNFWFYYWYFCFDSSNNTNKDTNTASSVTLCDSNCIEGFCSGLC
jgi:hypothetical protein